MKYIKAVATFESGKTLTYEKKSIIDIMEIRMRIEEIIERKIRLGMEVDKLKSFEIIK